MEAKQKPTKKPRINNVDKEEQNPPTRIPSHPSSRIFRVSRASGGKDRHSKVFTSKGLRDRRVRLSVPTAIQFYDLQDRLGFDQPSKAIEWLIKASSSAISQLPSLDFADIEPGCSSNSETSVLSLPSSETRIKARERARIRAAREDDFDATEQQVCDVNHSSFTELLSPESLRLYGQSSLCSNKGQIFSTSSSSMALMPYNVAAGLGDSAVMQQFSVVHDHVGCNHGFCFATGVACLQRGTLQSNAQFAPICSSSMDGQNLPFVFGSVASSAEAQFHSLFESRVQISKEPVTPFCLEGYRPSDLKGKRKS